MVTHSLGYYARLSDKERSKASYILFQQQVVIRQDANRIRNNAKERDYFIQLADAKIVDAKRMAAELIARAEAMVSHAEQEAKRVRVDLENADRRIAELQVTDAELQAEKDKIKKAGTNKIQRLVKLQSRVK